MDETRNPRGGGLRGTHLALVALAFALGIGATLLYQNRSSLSFKWPSGGSGVPPLVIIGLDGADWNIIDPLVKAGKMPHLAELVSRGARCRLLTISPTLSPVIWTSIATGVKPERHGIVDFTAINRETGEAIPVTSNLRRMPALWNRLSDAGITVGFTGWWASFPAERVKGYLVSDRIAYQLFGMKMDSSPEGKVFPQDAYKDIAPLILAPENVPDSLLARFFDDPSVLRTSDPEELELIKQFRTIVASSETYRRISAKLTGKYEPQVESVYFEGTDTVAHLFMRFRPPQMAGVTETGVRRFGGVIDRYYEYADELVGEIVARHSAKTDYVLCSDHGFRTDKDRPASTDSRIDRGRAADWHRKYGIFVVSGPGARQGAEIREATVFDVAPTVLALAGVPIPTNLDGRVLSDSIAEDFLRKHPLKSSEPAEGGEGGAAPPAVAGEGSPAHPSSTPPPSAPSTGGAAPVSTAEDEEIRQKLISLGYLTQESNNAHNNRGILDLSKGDYDKAILEFQAAMSANPDFSAGLVNIARCYWFKGDNAKAIDYLDRATKLTPNLKEVPLLLGNIALKAGDLATAEKHFLRALQLEPNDTDILNCLGLVYERRKEFDLAEARYRAAVDVDPDFAEGFNNLGNVAKRKGEAAAAENWYRKAIAADPFFMGAYANLALLYQEKGDLDRAADLYKQALEKDNANPDLHNNLGSLLFRRGDLPGAEASFRKAISLDKKFAEGYNSLGVVFGAQGKDEDERKSYEKAVQIRPDYADGLYNLALWNIKHGKDAEAEKLLQDAVRKQPDYAAALGTLGGIRLRKSDPSGARVFFERAVALQPKNGRFLALLGEACARLGDREAAVRALRNSLEVQPGQKDVQARLQDLVDRKK